MCGLGSHASGVGEKKHSVPAGLACSILASWLQAWGLQVHGSSRSSRAGQASTGP